MSRIRFGVLGAQGRMGKEVISLLEGYRQKGLVDIVPPPGRNDSLEALLRADVVIEFASTEAAIDLARLAVGAGNTAPVIIVGSTGWTDAQEAEIQSLAQKVWILRASNFSLGIQVCKMTLDLWKTFPGLSNWDVSIREWHHTRKKDAPSGTALTLKEALGRPVTIESFREGDVIGVHEVRFENEFETITLTHSAKKRSVFASGAIEAAFRLVEMRRIPGETGDLPRRILSLDDLYLRREA